LKELVAYMTRSLAGRPEEVVITEAPADNGTMYDLLVADEDIQHLIGKQGRTVRAMRSLLAAAATKQGRRCYLKISSPSTPQPARPEPSLSDDDDDDYHPHGQPR
jgi:predicted RNA-binding protein YlqC (UPF0109 family)